MKRVAITLRNTVQFPAALVSNISIATTTNPIITIFMEPKKPWKDFDNCNLSIVLITLYCKNFLDSLVN